MNRLFSKAKANGNHVVWTGDQIIPVPFTMTGLVTSDDFAFLRISGAGVICTGINVNFRVPAGDRGYQMQLALYTADNQLIPSTVIQFNGSQLVGDMVYPGGVKMPSGSLWKMRVTILNGDDNFGPQDMTVTYQLRYANGPARTNLWAAAPTLDGIGFYTLDGTFIVQ